MSIHPISNEKDILCRIAAGDVRAFTCVFDAYYKHLGQYVYRLTESAESTEEIVQDVFVKIWSKREDLAQVNSFKDYLFIITRNKTYRYLKQKADAHVKQQMWEKQYKEEYFVPDATTADDSFSEAFEQLLKKLPAQQRKVYELSKISRLKYAEIAILLNISPETVKKHIVSANKFLKDNLSDKIVGLVPVFMLLFWFFYNFFKTTTPFLFF